uniref:Metalloprotease TIKI homolog n=1 Tax=Panagrolaimus sp. JU765 TaxID=591449 RepID=A0AC34Q2E1_9BILA
MILREEQVLGQVALTVDFGDLRVLQIHYYFEDALETKIPFLEMIYILLCLFVATKQVNTLCTDQTRVPLWRLSHPQRNSPIFFFGTIHVAWDQVWPNVHQNIHLAFEAADTVVLEIALNSPGILEYFAKCRHLPNNVSLQKLLGRQLFRDINKYVVKKQKELVFDQRFSNGILNKFHEITTNWQRMKPTWVLFMLFHLLNLHDLPPTNSPMLDAFLANEAQRLNKKVESVENASEQCEPLQSLPLKDIKFAIQQTLNYLVKTDKFPSKTRKRQALQDILDRYQCGLLDDAIFDTTNFLDLETVDTHVINLQEQIKDVMINKRNIKIASRLHNLFQTNSDEVIFVALGAAHFIGESNIIKELETLKNYTVHAIDNDEILDLDYIRPQLLRNEKSFRNLWERNGENIQIESNFAVWQEEYPKVIFETNSAAQHRFITCKIIFIPCFWIWIRYFYKND